MQLQLQLHLLRIMLKQRQVVKDSPRLVLPPRLLLLYMLGALLTRTCMMNNRQKSMPERTAALSEAIQQQHAPGRDQHQQAMTPATDLLSASIPQLDRLPPGACAAGVLQGGKPNSGLPSTSSE